MLKGNLACSACVLRRALTNVGKKLCALHLNSFNFFATVSGITCTGGGGGKGKVDVPYPEYVWMPDVVIGFDMEVQPFVTHNAA